MHLSCELKSSAMVRCFGLEDLITEVTVDINSYGSLISLLVPGRINYFKNRTYWSNGVIMEWHRPSPENGVIILYIIKIDHLGVRFYFSPRYFQLLQSVTRFV